MSEKQSKSKDFLQIRVKSTEKDFLAENAEKLGVTMTQLCLYLIIEGLRNGVERESLFEFLENRDEIALKLTSNDQNLTYGDISIITIMERNGLKGPWTRRRLNEAGMALRMTGQWHLVTREIKKMQESEFNEYIDAIKREVPDTDFSIDSKMLPAYTENYTKPHNKNVKLDDEE